MLFNAMKKKIYVKVRPNSKKNEIKKTDNGYKISVTSAPENNKANQAVIDLLASFFKICKTKIKTVKGFSCREKIIEIDYIFLLILAEKYFIINS